MNLKKKLEYLGEKLTVPRDGRDLMRWSEAIKAAAKWKDSIDLLYDREAGKSASQSSHGNNSPAPSVSTSSKPPVVIEGKAIEVKEPTPRPPVTVEGAAQRVEVAAPQINVHIPAPSVSVTQQTAGNASGYAYLLDTAERVFSHAFTLFAGMTLGLLLAKKVLPLVGLQ